MKAKHHFLLLFMIVSFSCQRDDELPEQELKLVWETVISEEVNFGFLQPTLAGDLVLYGRGIDLSPENQTLLALNKQTGEVVWEWSDGISSSFPTVLPGKSATVISNNVFYFQNGPRTFAINLINGQTVWKTISPSVFPTLSCGGGCQLTFINNQLFRSGANSFEVEHLLRGQTSTGEFEITYTKDNESYESGTEIALSSPIGCVNSNGNTLLLFANSILYQASGIEPYLVGYNPETKEEVYRVLLDERAVSNTVDGLPLLYDNKVYLATNRMIKCHNPENGEEIWGQRFDGNFLFAGFTIGDGVVYGTHDNDYHTVAMDAETGRVLWRRKIAGTTSPIQYHNGVLYFVGGNTGLLHVIDAQTGNEIAAIQAPSQLRGDPDDYFSRDMRIDPESGMLFAKSLHHAYAYELYK